MAVDDGEGKKERRVVILGKSQTNGQKDRITGETCPCLVFLQERVEGQTVTSGILELISYRFILS